MISTRSLNRHIHLDFHTSGCIGDVGAAFNAAAFIARLRQADVAGVCVFGRCHHGYCYYPTRVGTMHPGLGGRDLLGEQLAALRDAGLVAGLYTTVCWDELAAAQHPEWLTRGDNNAVMKVDPLTGEARGRFEPGWNFLCWNTPYRGYFLAHVQELLEAYDADYMFLDIMANPGPCVCDCCIARMCQQGLDPTDAAARRKHALETAREFMSVVNEGIEADRPGMPVFYNARLNLSGDVEAGFRGEMPHYGLIGIESLPSGFWGYDHFPLMAKFFQNMPRPLLGYTGKFQTMWGDFGGLKNRAALDYESMRMMAHGVAACVGDQLPPNGQLDAATYELIGAAFAKLKPAEPHLLPSTPIDEIGVLLTNSGQANLEPETGIMKMLTQLHYQFSFIDVLSDWAPYNMLILPDAVILTDSLRERIEEYLGQGGKLLLSYRSGIDAEGNWVVPGLSMAVHGDLDYCPHYFHPHGSWQVERTIADTDHVQYLPGRRVDLLDTSAQVLARVTEPYFNRAWNRFCSHAQTPPARRTEVPEVVTNARNITYFVSSVFTCYHRYAPVVLKQMVDAAIRRLLGVKLVESNLPSTAEVTWRRSGDGAGVLTIMHYIPQRRGVGLDIVEDVIPLYDVSVSLAVSGARRVMDIHSGGLLSASDGNGRLEFTIPRIDGSVILRID